MGVPKKWCFFTSKLNPQHSDCRLRPGISLSSYGTNCAVFSGVPQEVISRAELYAQLQSRGEDLMNIIRGETNSEEARDLKVAEEVAKKFIGWDIDVTESLGIRDDLMRILE